jgi:hypothetical protein
MYDRQLRWLGGLNVETQGHEFTGSKEYNRAVSKGSSFLWSHFIRVLNSRFAVSLFLAFKRRRKFYYKKYFVFVVRN